MLYFRIQCLDEWILKYGKIKHVFGLMYLMSVYTQDEITPNPTHPHAKPISNDVC